MKTIRTLMAIAVLFAASVSEAQLGCPTWESYAAVRGRDYTDSNIIPRYGDVIQNVGWISGVLTHGTSMTFSNAGQWASVTYVAAFSNQNELDGRGQPDSVGGYVVREWRTPPGNWTPKDSTLISNSTPVTDTFRVWPFSELRIRIRATAAQLPDTAGGYYRAECCLINMYPVFRSKN